MPLAVETPMRMPVNEPGPVTTATASMSSIVSWDAAMTWSTIGSSVALCVSPQFWNDCASSLVSSVTQTEADSEEDSNVRIFKVYSLRLS